MNPNASEGLHQHRLISSQDAFQLFKGLCSAATSNDSGRSLGRKVALPAFAR